MVKFASLLVCLASAAAAAEEKGKAEDKGKDPPYPRINLAPAYRVDPNWPAADQLPTGHVPGVAVDSADNVYVFIRAKQPVRVFSREGKLLRTWGDDSVGLAHHLKIDHEGFIWLADIGLHVVRKYTTEGKVLATFGTPGVSGDDERRLDKPTDMAITPAGDVFIADGYGNNRIVHFDKNGRFVKQWGKLGVAPGEFSLPHAIALDSKGRLYVADRNNVRVQVFEQSGKLVDVWRDIVTPWGFWVQKNDEVWVCGNSPMPWRASDEVLACPPKDQVFMRFAPSGRLLQLWTVPKSAIDGRERPGELNWLHCIAVDSQGSIYAGDIIGKRIQKFVRVGER